MDKRSLCLYLLASVGVPLRKIRNFLEKWKAEDVFQNPEEASEDLAEELRGKFLQRCHADLLEEEIFSLRRKGIFLCTIYNPQYPALLKESKQKPILLYYRGDLSCLGEKAISIVGTRHASRNGMQNVRRIAGELAEAGVIVISGMAYGIDTAANTGALEAGGKTVAVLGSGIDVPYPKNNSKLYEKIADSGVIFSEYPPGMPPYPNHFPIRNRIIIGLSKGVLVAEGKEGSGTEISVELAKRDCRDLFALPGDIANPLAQLPLALLEKEGAILVRNTKSILHYYGWKENLQPEEEPPALDFFQGQLYNLLMQGEATADFLQEQLGCDMGQLNVALLQMELQGRIARLPGNRYCMK